MIRPSNAADLAKFFPDLTCSFRSWTGLVENEPVIVGGIAMTRPFPSIFSAVAEGFEWVHHDFGVRRIIKRIELAAKALKRPVVGVVNEGGSPALMMRMGFVHVGEDADARPLYQLGGLDG